MARIDAWFCSCHAYNTMRIIEVDIPIGTIYQSWETCRRCDLRQRVNVRAGYFR